MTETVADTLVDSWLADLERRGLIEVAHPEGRLWIRPRIGARQLLQIVCDVCDSTEVGRGMLEPARECPPEMPIEALTHFPDVDEVTSWLIRHASRYPGGRGSDLGPTPEAIQGPGVRIKTFRASELGEMVREFVASHPRRESLLAELDQSFMTLQEEGWLRAWADEDGPAVCYQMRVVDGEISRWPRGRS